MAVRWCRDRDRLADVTTTRSLMDRAAVSAGWTVDTDPRGRLRAMSWPLPVGPPLVDVSDCADTPTGALPAVNIRFQSDMAELLTVGVVTTAADVEVSEADPVAVNLYGIRSDTLGFPVGPVDVDEPAARTLARSAVDRYAHAVERVETITVDAARHPAWLDVLARIGRGDTIRIHRTVSAPVTMLAVVTGVQHDIGPGRWTATITLTTP
jgi:hypothetical protein